MGDKPLLDGTTIRVAAYGLVVREKRILLCRISPRVAEWAGFWTLPGGGIDFGEDPAEAMVREVREETGLHVRPAGVAGIDSLVVTNGSATTHSLRIIYFVEIIGGALSNELDGSTDLCAWHRLDVVRSLPIVGLVKNGLDLVGSARESTDLRP